MLSLFRLSPLIRVSRLLSTGSTSSTEETSSEAPTSAPIELDFDFEEFVEDIGLDVEGYNTKGLSFAKMLRLHLVVNGIIVYLRVGLSIESSILNPLRASPFRQSKFVQLGDFKGRLVIGKIVHRMMDDLYIDIGLKFNTVVRVPPINNEQYCIGARVLLRLHDCELSERFLGSKNDLTLLEADATLIRLLRSGVKQKQKRVKEIETADNLDKDETKEDVENSYTEQTKTT